MYINGVSRLLYYASIFVEKSMKIIIEDGICAYESDFSRKDKIKGGMLEEYYPSVDECFQEFVHLLSCYRGTDAVKEYLRENNIVV